MISLDHLIIHLSRFSAPTPPSAAAKKLSLRFTKIFLSYRINSPPFCKIYSIRYWYKYPPIFPLPTPSQPRSSHSQLLNLSSVWIVLRCLDSVNQEMPTSKFNKAITPHWPMKPSPLLLPSRWVTIQDYFFVQEITSLGHEGIWESPTPRGRDCLSWSCQGTPCWFCRKLTTRNFHWCQGAAVDNFVENKGLNWIDA